MNFKPYQSDLPSWTFLLHGVTDRCVSFYLFRDLFLCNHLTVWHWDRLLIEIITLCRGVASLGIFSVNILIGQVDRKWGGREEASRFDWESVVSSKSA